jgi:ABC-2 type transport system ATP-binding protein
LVTGLQDRGKTVFLTTHLMEEAERLCDRVAIIEHGRVIEMGSPAALVKKHCPQRAVVFSCDRNGIAALLEGIPSVEAVSSEGLSHRVSGSGEDFVTDIIHLVSQQGLRVSDFRTVLPTLEDVFLKLTGHTIRD